MFSDLFAINNARNSNAEVFLLGTEGNLFHRYFAGKWTSWATFPPPGINGVRDIAGINNGHNSNLELFAIDSFNTPFHRYYSTAWSSWAPFMKNLTYGLRQIFPVTNGHNSNTELLAIGADKQPYHSFFSATSGWRPWADFRRNLKISAARISAVTNGHNGDVEVFLAGTDNKLYHCYFNPAIGWSPWSDFSAGLPTGVRRLAAAGNAHNKNVEAFAVGSDGRIYHRYFHPSINWSQWADFTRNLGASADRVLAVTNAHNANLELLVIGTDKKLRHSYYHPNGGWRQWNSFQANLAVGVTRLSAVSNGHNDNLEVFALGADGKAYHRFYSSSVGWSQWAPFSFESKLLPVGLRPQRTSSWCWAAGGEMVMAYGGKQVDQCTQANARFGRSDCCKSPAPAACNQGGQPEFHKWGFWSNSTALGTALSFSSLRAQIDANLPVYVGWKYSGGKGHAVVAVGYSTLGGGFVRINDPSPEDQGDQRWITYSAYVNGNGLYSHSRDIYNIGKPKIGKAAAEEEQAESVMIGDPERTGSNGGDSAEATAAAALELLPVLMAEEGFDHRTKLTLGDPLSVSYLWSESLATEETSDLRSLLSDGRERLFPVLREHEVVATVTVVEREGQWRVKSLGDENLARAVAATREILASGRARDEPECSIVHVPEMYLTFLVHREEGETIYSPVFDNDELGWHRGTGHTGRELLRVLVPLASEASGDVVEPIEE